jgi:hypothetical protein
MAKMSRLFWPSDSMPILAVCSRPVMPYLHIAAARNGSIITAITAHPQASHGKQCTIQHDQLSPSTPEASQAGANPCHAAVLSMPPQSSGAAFS